MYLPTPSSVCTVASMGDYHIVSFGDEDSGTYVITVMRDGACHDSYVVVGRPSTHANYITLPFER